MKQTNNKYVLVWFHASTESSTAKWLDPVTQTVVSRVGNRRKDPEQWPNNRGNTSATSETLSYTM